MEEDWRPFPDWEDWVMPASFAFGYPPQMPLQVSPCLSTQGKHLGKGLSRKCWSQISPQIHPFCGSTLRGRIWVLFPSPWLLCQVGSWWGNKKPAQDSWLLAEPLSPHCDSEYGSEVWGHLWVSLISPDSDKTQPWSSVDPGCVAAVTQKVMKETRERKKKKLLKPQQGFVHLQGCFCSGVVWNRALTSTWKKCRVLSLQHHLPQVSPDYQCGCGAEIWSWMMKFAL